MITRLLFKFEQQKYVHNLQLKTWSNKNIKYIL